MSSEPKPPANSICPEEDENCPLNYQATSITPISLKEDRTPLNYQATSEVCLRDKTSPLENQYLSDGTPTTLKDATTSSLTSEPQAFHQPFVDDGNTDLPSSGIENLEERSAHQSRGKQPIWSEPLGFEYGEPLQPQHLVLDFTPVAGEDDVDILMDKCNAFWNFIDSFPELEKYRVSPDKEIEDGHAPTDLQNSSTFAKDSESDVSRSDSMFDERYKAVPWLARNKLMNPAFVSRLDTGGYCQDAIDVTTQKATKPGSSHSTESGSTGLSRDRQDASALCRQFDEWDQALPESMEPPGSIPKYGYMDTVLQRTK